MPNRLRIGFSPNGLMLRLVLLAGFVLVPGVAPAQASPAADAWASVRDTVREVMARSNTASISIAVARGGKIVWEEAFGWADREKQIRATPNTIYSLASISKPMTATGLMTLVESGRIDLDRPANDYLGAGKLTGLAGDATGATVRRVMSHTAGLPLHYRFYYSSEPYPVLSNDEAISRYGILVYPPGEVFEYSNLGYGIIDHIISRISGVDYAEFMRTRVFQPLGLTRTSVGIAPGFEGSVAQRYDQKQLPIPFYDFDHRGGSAIFSSAHDLVRFGMFHLKDHLGDQHPILKDSTIDAMHRAVPPANYGLGWLVNEREGTRIVFHSGGMTGVETLLLLYPAEDVAVVVLANYYYVDISRVTREIERAFLPRYAEARRRANAGGVQQTAAAAAQRFTPPGELVGEWTGTVRTWESSAPLSLLVGADGGVQARLGDQPAAPVGETRWQDGTFTGRFAGTIPTSDARRWPHSVVLSLRLHGATLNGFAAAVTPDNPVHFALSSYASLTKKGATK